MGRGKKSKKLKTVGEQRSQKNTVKKSNAGKKFLSKKVSNNNSNQNQKFNKAKKSKTPAQDRLRKVVTGLKSNQLVERIEVKLDTNIKQLDLNHPVNKRKRESLSESTTPIKLQKTIRSYASGSECNDVAAYNVIPDIFPLETRAQDRLRKLQQQLKLDNCNTEIAEANQVNEQSKKDKENNVLHVLQQGFGIGENTDDANNPQEIQQSNESEKQTDSEKQDEMIHVVLDTNVMLKSLSYIEKSILKDERRFLHVPYVVLKELDSLKKREKQAENAARAMRFIYTQLYSEQPRFQGQKAAADSKHTIQIDIDDDRILNCCVQLKNRMANVILLTNDLNLLSKARLNDINAIRMHEYAKKYGVKKE